MHDFVFNVFHSIWTWPHNADPWSSVPNSKYRPYLY